MSVNFEGYNEKILTFEKDTGSITIGYPVKVSSNGKVSQCSSGDKFCGFAVSVRENLVGVQMSGYKEIKYANAERTALYSKKVDDSISKVEISSNINRSITGDDKIILLKVKLTNIFTDDDYEMIIPINLVRNS